MGSFIDHPLCQRKSIAEHVLVLLREQLRSDDLVSDANSGAAGGKGVRNERLRVPNKDVPTRILMCYIVPRVDVAYTSDTICID